MKSHLLAMTIFGLLQTSAYGGTLWIGPSTKSVDIAQMFDSTSAWKYTAGKINTIKVYGDGYIFQRDSNAVEALVKTAQSKDLKLALEVGVMNIPPRPKPSCGGWGLVEGYGSVAMQKIIVEKIKAAGGTLAYIAMDEPLWYGHYFEGLQNAQPGCKSSIDTIAELSAQGLKVYTDAFPQIEIIDIEPSNIAMQPGWEVIYRKWATTLSAKINRPISAIHIDMGLAQPGSRKATDDLLNFCIKLKAEGLIRNIGVIYGGKPTDKSDAEWVRSADESAKFVETELKYQPDQVVIQSWHPYPAKNLPESNPDSLTGFANKYITSR